MSASRPNDVLMTLSTARTKQTQSGPHKLSPTHAKNWTKRSCVYTIIFRGFIVYQFTRYPNEFPKKEGVNTTEDTASKATPEATRTSIA